MNGCKSIKERIDQAEKPDLLPFEIAEHIGRCSDCEAFATERRALRQLIAGDVRVNAPINFDAMLNAQLVEMRGRRWSWRFGSPAFLRLGAATAGLAVMIFAAQYAGLFSNNAKPPTNPEVAAAVPLIKPSPVDVTPPDAAHAVAAVAGRQYATASGASRARRGGPIVDMGTPDGFITAEDGGVVLVRGRNGDLDVQMPTVSVGAQPLIYVSAGQRPVRNVGASF